MSAFSINKHNYTKEVQQSDVPVLLDFWAPWCGPCRMFSPVIDEIAHEHANTVKVGKVNIDEEPELAKQFNVMSIPTLVLIEHGQVKAITNGVKPKYQVEQMLNAAAR